MPYCLYTKIASKEAILILIEPGLSVMIILFNILLKT